MSYHQLTGDGSSTLYSDRFEETYHSRHGAVQESQHVFIAMGWEALSRPQEKAVCVLEMGFGTGLNALLTAVEAARIRQTVHYHSIEAYPLPETTIQELNYGQMLGQADLFREIHQAAWNQECEVSPWFRLKKYHTPLEAFFAPDYFFDLVFYDAFAPNAQPELWTTKVFRKLHAWMAPGGILTTYCAKGDVRRSMQTAGFEVERLPGPPGKREMLRATKPSQSFR